MVSVLIPTYRYDVRLLVRALYTQIEHIKSAEIIVLDDCSPEEDAQINAELSAIPEVRFLRNEKNIGRSATRNKLALSAKNDCLIFIDGDTMPVNENFVSNYLKEFENSKFLFGGIKYDDKPPAEKQEYLRWFYGKRREEIAVTEREKQGNRLLMTGNFCISKALFEKIRFDENITRYGHEDTLFALQTAENGIFVKHIDNPMYHLGLESNAVFLSKTLVALENLYYIQKLGTYNDLLNTIRLWKTYQRFRFLKPVFVLMFRVFKSVFEQNLKGTKPRLLFFDLYKLFALAKFEGDYSSKTNL